MTTEQYSGVVPRQINALNVSRDTLNPLLNTTVLKQRLAAIEHYRLLHGVKYARWPHVFMGRMSNYMWTYKFNLVVKGAAAYMTFREIQNYRNLNEKTLMTFEQSFEGFGAIGAHAALFGTLCALV